MRFFLFRPTRSSSLRAVALVTGLLVCTGAVAVSAQATPPGPGPAPYLPTPSNVGQGTLEGPITIKQDGIQLKVRPDDATIREFDLTYPVGTFSGWHRHPGLVIAVVQSGTVSRQTADCDVATFHVGQAFYEVGDHFVWNPDPVTPAVLKITQIMPAGEMPRSEVEQRCPIPIVPPVLAGTTTSNAVSGANG